MSNLKGNSLPTPQPHIAGFAQTVSSIFQKPFGKGPAVYTLGTTTALPPCVSSRVDSGLCPLSDLGVALAVRDFPSSLSQLLLLLWQRCGSLQWGGSCPEISYLCSSAQCCFSWTWGLLSQGEEDGNGTQHQLTSVSPKTLRKNISMC